MAEPVTKTTFSSLYLALQEIGVCDRGAMSRWLADNVQVMNNRSQTDMGIVWWGASSVNIAPGCWKRFKTLFFYLPGFHSDGFGQCRYTVSDIETGFVCIVCDVQMIGYTKV